MEKDTACAGKIGPPLLISCLWNEKHYSVAKVKDDREM